MKGNKAMTFSFGIFNPLSRSPGESYRDSFQRGVAETLYAEALGFDAIWVPFTQLSPDFCFDAPTMVSAMMQASKTTRIKIGLAMQYMPFMHPWDVAAM